MCYSYPRLRELVEKKLKRSPESEDLYLFVNRKTNYVKILYYNEGDWHIHGVLRTKGKFDLESSPKRFTTEVLGRLINQVVNGKKDSRHLKVAA